MKIVASITVVMLLISGAVRAHPHVFVNAQAGFQVDADQRLHALRIVWQYDAFTTLFLLETLDLDIKPDGQLTDADRAAIAAAETDWPPGYNGDVNLSIAGDTVQMGRPQNATAQMINGQVIVSFDLPVANATDLSGKSASLRLYDPAYYYAYSVSVDPATQNMVEPCATTAIPFEPDEAEAETLWTLATLSREETPTEQNIGARFADEIVMTCN